MTETPLRRYLDEVRKSAEVFAAEKDLSPWSVRHWTRGNKLPELKSQIKLQEATGGIVTPADWLAWDIGRQVEQSEKAA